MKLVDLGVDYVTITEKDAEQWALMLSYVERTIVPYLEGEGHTWTKTKVLGYQGSRLGTMFVGTRPDSSMVRMSGSLCEAVFPLFLQSFPEMHITRLDLQGTVQYEYDVVDKAERLRDEVLWFQKCTPRTSHPGIQLLQTHGRGDTLQLGARSSDTFCRIYDKWREQGLEYLPNTWRFEVELKGEMAACARNVLREPLDWSRTILDMLSNIFKYRGVDEDWMGWMVPHKFERVKSQTDTERQLRWLETHVSPTVRKLIDLGYKDEMLDMFGLDML